MESVICGQVIAIAVMVMSLKFRRQPFSSLSAYFLIGGIGFVVSYALSGIIAALGPATCISYVAGFCFCGMVMALKQSDESIKKDKEDQT